MNETSRGSASASPPGFGVTWGGPPRVAARGLTVVAAAALIAGMAGPASAAPTASSAAPVAVIVQELPGTGTLAEQTKSGFTAATDPVSGPPPRTGERALAAIYLSASVPTQSVLKDQRTGMCHVR